MGRPISFNFPTTMAKKRKTAKKAAKRKTAKRRR